MCSFLLNRFLQAIFSFHLSAGITLALLNLLARSYLRFSPNSPSLPKVEEVDHWLHLAGSALVPLIEKLFNEDRKETKEEDMKSVRVDKK